MGQRRQADSTESESSGTCTVAEESAQQNLSTDQQAEKSGSACVDEADHGVLIDCAGNEIGVDDGSAAGALEYVWQSHVRQCKDGMERGISPPKISVSEDGSDYEVTCTQRARGRVLMVHTRSDSLIWVTDC